MICPCSLCGNQRRVWWLGFFVTPLCEECIKKIDWSRRDIN